MDAIDVQQLAQAIQNIDVRLREVARHEHRTGPHIPNLIKGMYNVRDFGAVGNGVADDTLAIQGAANAGGDWAAIVFPAGVYRHTATLSPAANGQRWMGLGSGAYSSGPYLIYDGPVDAAIAQIHVPTGRDGFHLSGLNLDAGLKAGICVHLESADGMALHHPTLEECHFQGYTSRGVVIGKNETSLIGTVQMQIVVLNNLSWQGGTPGAIGLLINSQNAEFTNASSLYFDPIPGNEHSHHIWIRAGGLNIRSLLSTRATVSAIHTYEQLIITGWRTEDQALISSSTAAASGPSHIIGIEHRPDGGTPAPTALTIDWNLTERPSHFQGSIWGSFRIGPTTERTVDAAILFRDAAAGAGFILLGPPNQRGLLRDVETGITRLMGTAPSITGLTDAGAQKWHVGVGAHFGNLTLATAATTGFVQIPTMTGPPTGTPVLAAGQAPMCVENNGATRRLWLWVNAAWRSVNLT